MNKRISTKHRLTLTKVTNSYLTLMEILSHLKDDEMMRIKTKNPSLESGKSTEGSKSHHKSAGESVQVEEPRHTAKDLEEPAHLEFKTGVTKDQPDEETSQLPDWESARDVYSKRRIIAITKLQIVEWHNYKHLDWITVRRDDNKLYKFKEGDFNRLCIQDIEDMLLLLVQGKLTNLTVKERLDFNVSLRLFTRSIVIKRHVEDLQLGVESYQKKLNLTKPNTYRSDLKRREAYTAYSNPRVTRPKKYSELSATEAIQAGCDIKATNNILQGLPPEVYALVSNHKVAKELWERIQLLMQGTSLTKQERECKLYDEFDKFAYKKGEILRDLYLRFSLLLNDMNIYNMKLEQFQVNTKFLNTLPPEWSKFVRDFKLVWDLHTTNIDQLHAYLGQHEFHGNEVRLMHECNSDPLALVATHQMTQSPYQTHQNSYQNSQFQPQVSLYQSLQHGSPYQSQQYSNNQSSTPLSITYPSSDYQSSVHYNVYSPSSSTPQLEYAPTFNQQPEFPQLDSNLIVLVFQKGDDAINHMMSFLNAVVTSRYPTTNN
ncbi:hypothetical protein Tco_0031278 [Tanacetum coccineum]